jgi:hypothetical protein
MLRHLEAIAQDTLQCRTKVRRSAFRGFHPRSIDERWFVTHVLAVMAIEFRDPVAELVLVVTAYRAFQLICAARNYARPPYTVAARHRNSNVAGNDTTSYSLIGIGAALD